MKKILLFIAFFWSLTPLFSQDVDLDKVMINNYTIEANKLIWHINLNIKNLASYQSEMNAWYTNNTKKISQAPTFKFATNIEESAVKNLLLNTKIQPSNPAFNYQTTLNNLNKQILLFNSFCLQLQGLAKVGSKDDYYKKGMTILYQLDGMAPDMVNLCYDFSLSCAINFGKEKLPVEIDRLKNTVGQTKNVIMAIRENNPMQVKAYLNQLNASVNNSRIDQRFNDLKRIGRFNSTEEELKQMHDLVLTSANQIAYWAEQYLQSNHTENEVNPILEHAIIAFNVIEGKAGCSGAYNQMVAQAKTQYLFFTEEPMFFKVEEKDKIKELIEVVAVKKDTVVLQQPKLDPIVKVTAVNTPKPKVFNESDISTLDGALPNNIIIMMDVSASMKVTGKLPLLKKSIVHLLDIMRPEDRISLIAYSGEADVLIANAGIGNRGEVKQVLDTLHSSGGTDILNGVKLGYETALKSFMQQGNNRIIIATDGEFGVKPDLLKLVREESTKKIYLSVFQFNDTKSNEANKAMENLAVSGRGNYHRITNSEEALEILIKEVKKK